MINFLGVLYGLHLVLVVYLMTYFAAKGLTRGSVTTLGLVLGKYLIYWAIITFGFKHLPFWSIMGGFVGGMYLSLPGLYFLNKRLG